MLNRTGKAKLTLFNPHPRQNDILRAALDPKTFYITAVIGRQFGKSTLGLNLALYWAINDPKSVVWWVSPTSQQALKVQNEIIKAIHQTGLIESKKKAKDDAVINFTNGSRINFKSAGSEDSLRGESVHYLICDEAASIKKSTVEEIITPTLTVTGKKFVCLGTPKGRSNWLHEVYQRGLNDKTGRYASFTCPSYESPFVTDQVIQDFRERLPEKVFQQEIMADFVDGAAVFDNITECLVLDKKQGCGEKYVYQYKHDHPNKYRDNCFPEKEKGDFYIGIDIGMVNDFTVVTILNGDGDLIHYYKFTKMDGNQIGDKICEIINKWNPRMSYIESNNQGLPIYSFIKTKLGTRYIKPFYTSTKTKPDMINDLVYAFNTKSIKCVNCEDLRIELENFIFIQSDTGYIKYQAASGGHDDLVMSLAIARLCFKENKFSSLYSKVY